MIAGDRITAASARDPRSARTGAPSGAASRLRGRWL